MFWPFNFPFQNTNTQYFQYSNSDFLKNQNAQLSQSFFNSSLQNYLNNSMFNYNQYQNSNFSAQANQMQSQLIMRQSSSPSRSIEVIQIQSSTGKKQNNQNNSHDNSIKREDNELHKSPLYQGRVVRYRRKRKSARSKNMISHNCSLRNDTKNIPKNYGKAMLTFIQKNFKIVKQLLSKHQIDYLEFMMMVKKYKMKINTIHDLREMWGQKQNDNKDKRCLRILCYHFMRKKCLPYIFNSRVKNYNTHIKYRKRIMEGIQKPDCFTSIKQF